MRRRRFLSASLAALPTLSYARPTWMPRGAMGLLGARAESVGDRVLVVVGLGGGNDGLNTVVPLAGYDRLAQHRRSVLLPESSLLRVDPAFAFHPAMGGARTLFDDAKLGIVHSVGYPDPNRSHFRSANIYRNGSPADEVWSSGWLGRRYQQVHPAFPSGYPTANHPDPLSITISRTPTGNCESNGANFSYPVASPGNARELIELSGPRPAGSRFGEELAFARMIIKQSNRYGATVDAKYARGLNLATYPDTRIGDRLAHVARMISGGLRTSMYYVPQPGGYDTHDNQVEDGDHTTGKHAELLGDLSDAILAFQTDLEMLGLAERVVGVTYSEFGRQIGSNASGGTDHGEAAPLFLFGDAVVAGALGATPEIPDQIRSGQALPMEYDFRDVYATLLTDWFGSPAADVDAAFEREHTWLPIINPNRRASADHLAAVAAGAPREEDDADADPGDDADAGIDAGPTTGVADVAGRDLALAAAPNPFGDRTRLTFALAAAARVRLVAYDNRGAEVETLFDRRLPAGEHGVGVDTAAYPTGRITFRLSGPSRAQVCTGLKL